MVKIIPISKAYREGHEKIRWDSDNEVDFVTKPLLGVTNRDGSPLVLPSNWGVCETKVYPAVGWVLGECNYQGC
jgi:hypothetical protein